MTTHYQTQSKDKTTQNMTRLEYQGIYQFYLFMLQFIQNIQIEIRNVLNQIVSIIHTSMMG